jgi:hypothetical protein
MLRHKFLQNLWFQGAFITLLVFVIYRLTGRLSTPYNHYVLLADAFLKGRLYLVNAPPWLEVARYGNKAFVIDPPVPTLFLLPWVALWGARVNQVLVSMIVGAAAMGLFWIAAFRLRWDLALRVAITFLLALGTNLWWAATDGGLWTFAHVSAVFFLMAALVETAGSNRPWLIGLFVGLAGLSRLPAFLVFPFFAYTISCGIKGRQRLIRLAAFGFALGIIGGVYLAYNYGRFGTFSDLGYYHPRYSSEPWFSKGRFDVSYIPRHIKAIFYTLPKFTNEFPFIKPTYIGMGLFFTTPAFLYIFKARLRGLTLASIVGILTTVTVWVTHGVTGWAQFGYRYSLDVLPLLAILTADGMNYKLSRFKVVLIILSCLINLWGTLSFNKFNWVE